MAGDYTSRGLTRDLSLWERVENRRVPLAFEIEATARCPNDCRHCYINLPADDTDAQRKELSPAEIGDLGRQAARLGALFCVITGGEPLLRPDFPDLYLALKQQGLLVSVYTSATLITPHHVALFRKYPPRDVETTVYGVSEQTYEQVTRRPGSYGKFLHGLKLLEESGIPVRLKAMALRSNLHEFTEIAAFGRDRTKDYFRFDTLLHSRLDRNSFRNQEIRAERISPEETVGLERADAERSRAMKNRCEAFIDSGNSTFDVLLRCGAGEGKFCITWDGMFQLCSSLRHPACMYDLRTGTLEEAWNRFTPGVRAMRAANSAFRATCGSCPIINLCLWCPANAYLETGSLERYVPEFCKVAHARARALKAAVTGENPAATRGLE